MPVSQLPKRVEVVIEVPLGSFLKRGANGVLDYVSPFPAPFNYGCIPAIAGQDGDALDAVLLGPRRPRDHRETAEVLGIVRFVDAGQVDDKVLCGTSPLRQRDKWLVISFFRGYGIAKGLLNVLRRKPGKTSYLGWQATP